MFELLGDHDVDLIECQDDDIQSDEEALTASMWHDYSAVFPMLHDQGRALARRNEWQFVVEDLEGNQ